ncbi:MAG TPA: hypothetical protein VKT72_15730 [Candidatus Baltobacteraceae bacterium]|nr:hypothetical protein [Candidatus Baltobacteraceae bacterium]
MITLRRFFGRWEAAALISPLVGFLASWRLQFETGTIGLFHDWSISPTTHQNIAYAAQLFNGWYRWILGEPVIYPTEYPVRFAFAAAGLLGINGDTVSHAFVFLVPAAAFFTAWLLARQLSGSTAGSIAAGVLYALNPVMLNKMVSGQASYVVGYCALPLVLWAFERAIASRSHIKSAGFGAALALAGVQLQLGLLGAFIAVIDALIPRRDVPLGRRLATLVIGFAVALLIQLPTVIGIAGGAPGYENIAQFSNSAAYVSMNSVAFPEAVRLMGYLTRYADVAIQQWAGLWNIAMFVLLAAVLIGIAASPKRFRALSCIVLVATFLLVSGAQSPFAPGILWLFQHVRYMQVFRELYHLMAVIVLIYACSLALFFRYVRTFKFYVPVYIVVAAALVLVCAPMMSGDASGWMRAFPIRSAYEDAFAAQSHGSSRVLWLPMDQPLSFDGHGAGVDPMAVSSRGTLWDYALNWPLTAVDTDIHDGGDLKTALRALSVGDVVERIGMESELARFTVDGTDTEPFLARSVPLDLPQVRRYRNAIGYTVANPVQFATRPREIALVPQRLSVCAEAITKGYAPVAYSANVPSNVPYAMMYDPADAPEEAVELADAARPLQVTSIDARLGFAPSDVWWWHRKEYADVSTLTLTFDRHVNALSARQTYRNAVAVVAWIATSAGGRVRISSSGHSIVIDTNGSGEWRSRAVRLGAIAAGMPIAVTSLDKPAEVAIRGFTVIEESQYRQMLRSWRRTLDRAAARVAIVQSYRQVFLRAGSSRSLGFLSDGTFFRLVLQQRANARVEDTSGYPMARIARSDPFFSGIGADARVVSRKPIGTWKLYRVSVSPLRIPAPALDDSSRLLSWNWAFGDWRTPSPSSRLRSALGTTIFVFAHPERNSTVYYPKSSAFHIAYVVGVLTLLLVLAALAAEKARRAVQVKTARVEFSAKDVKA